MEKLKLKTGKLYDIVTNGIMVDDSRLAATISPGQEDSLSAIFAVMSDPKATAVMTLLSEAGEELAVYSGYTDLSTISYDTEEEVVHVTMKKPDEIALRLAAIEEQMTDAQMALCDIYELIA